MRHTLEHARPRPRDRDGGGCGRVASLIAFCVAPLLRVLHGASPPDLLLDANVSVPFIGLTVTNLSAHVALDAKIAALVSLSVGIDINVANIKSERGRQAKHSGGTGENSPRRERLRAGRLGWLTFVRCSALCAGCVCSARSLTIKDVSATVHLEARLHEVTLIVQSVMQSLNLNPILLALAQGLVTDVGALTGAISTVDQYARTARSSSTGAAGR